MSKKGKEKAREYESESSINSSSEEENIVNDKLLKELMNHQLDDIPSEWKLEISDMKRICQYINSSIFDMDKCSLWQGYITNENNTEKGRYVNFYYNRKKVALHRLLHINYVTAIDDKFYLKFKCSNKGKCCNIHHCEKHKYIKTSSPKKSSSIKKLMISSSSTIKLNLDSDSE
jgi:hypothetical protein